MVNTRVMALLQQRAVAAITEARERGETGAIDARSFVFDDDFRTLDIYPTGTTPATEREVVAAYGEALLDAVIASPSHPKRLIQIAHQCISGEISVTEKAARRPKTGSGRPDSTPRPNA